MSRHYSKYIPTITGLGDLLILNFCFNIGFWYIKGFDFYTLTTNAIMFFFFINIAWVVSANIFEAYKIEHHSIKKVILFNNVKTVIVFFFLFLLYFQLLSFNYYTRDQVKYLFVTFFFLLIAWKFFLYYLFLFYRKLGYNYRNVIIIGYGDAAVELQRFFKSNPEIGYRFNGFITRHKSDKKDIIGCYDDIESIVINNKIDEIYIMTTDINENVNIITSSIMSKYSISVRLVPDLSNFAYRNVDLVKYGMVPIMNIQQGPLNYWYNRAVKRLSDIAISIIVILFILSWLVPLLVVVDIFSGLNGVFFVQHRSGLDNREFKVIKFRTMKKNNEANIKQAEENDHRITKIGRLLRKTSIDELPQFFNVLAGSMSVAGPRPHMLSHTEEYKAIVSKFMIRHSVKPGITGYAQVRGFRGEIKKIKDMEERVRQDVFYIENWTIWLDIKIMFLTVSKFFKGDEKAY